MKKIILIVIMLALGIVELSAGWEKCSNGMYGGGTISSIALSGNDIFVGAGFNGIYLSTDNGETWNERNNGFPSNYVSGLVINANKIFASTQGGGILLSTDNGDSWIEKNNGLSDYIDVRALALTGTKLFAVTLIGGIYVSTNYGDSWTKEFKGLPNKRFSTIASNGVEIMAGTYDDEIFHSTDSGENWVQKTSGAGHVHKIVFNGNKIYVCTSSGLNISTNSGNSWLLVPELKTSLNSIAIIDNYIFIGTNFDGMFLSSDYGATWNKNIIGDTATSIGAMTVKNKSIFVTTNKGSMFLSSDYGANWIEKNKGLTILSINTIAYNSGNIFAGTYDSGVYLSTDNGNNWTAKNKGLTNLKIKALAIKGNLKFAGTDGNGIFISSDNGDNWTILNNDVELRYIYSLTIHGSNIFAGTHQGILLSTDNGKSWSNKVASPLRIIYVEALTVIGNNILAGTNGYGIWVSADTLGNGWSSIKSPYNLSPKDDHAHAIIASGNNCIAGTSDGIYVASYLTGNNWTVRSPGNLKIGAYSLETMGNNVFAGTTYGLYLSTDNGENWALSNSLRYPINYIDIGINTIKIIGDYIYVGTFGGVFKSKVMDLGVSVEDNKLKFDHSNLSITPNPANEYIEITGLDYFVPELIDFCIYNPLGVCVKVLVAGNQKTDSKKIDISDLPQGLYFCSVSAGGKKVTKSFSVVR